MESKKNSASLITYRFFDFDNSRVCIGGIETYTYDLSQLLISEGYDVTVCILTPENRLMRSVEYRGITIKEMHRPKGKNGNDKAFQQLYHTNAGNGLYIIMTDGMEIDASGKRNVVTIQHGVSWDFPAWAMNPLLSKFKWAFRFRKLHIAYKQACLFRKSSNMVCVDYNYYNWIRTVEEIDDDAAVAVIPNYSSAGISDGAFQHKLNQLADLKSLKIVFARRLTKYRGSELFSNVAARLLAEYPNLHIMIAGEGEDEKLMKSKLKGYKQVEFTKYSAIDSVGFHSKYDLAVVPTIYSEGTSLSLCEAMAAGCYPVATHVGGLTNLLIDSYNGSLCYPSEKELYQCLKMIIDGDIDNFRTIVKNAYQSYKASFCKEKWESSWRRFLREVACS